MKNGDMPISAIVNENGAPMHHNQVGIHDGCLTGLTKREYAAIKAMQGYIAGITGWSDGLEGGGCNLDYDDCAEEAVRYADALLTALKDK